jgi:hypothetical protein
MANKEIKIAVRFSRENVNGKSVAVLAFDADFIRNMQCGADGAVTNPDNALLRMLGVSELVFSIGTDDASIRNVFENAAPRRATPEDRKNG